MSFVSLSHTPLGEHSPSVRSPFSDFRCAAEGTKDLRSWIPLSGIVEARKVIDKTRQSAGRAAREVASGLQSYQRQNANFQAGRARRAPYSPLLAEPHIKVKFPTSCRQLPNVHVGSDPIKIPPYSCPACSEAAGILETSGNRRILTKDTGWF